MEQQEEGKTTLPIVSRTIRNKTKKPRRRVDTPPSPSSVAVTGVAATEPSPSTAEPSLCFPRPQGNRRLAHWISRSDPDIMHPTTSTTDDNGLLSESTYELVSSTDSESQDGNYTESISESVGSLDFHRPDDVVSLTGTEQYDDDSVIDILESRHNFPSTSTYSETVESLNTAVMDEAGSHNEAASRSSLEYADNSLRTPSILTPEASRLLLTEDFPAKERSWQMTASACLATMQQWVCRVGDLATSAASTALPGLACAVIVASIVQVFFMPASINPSSSPPVIEHTTTLVITTSTVATSTASVPTTGVALIPLADSTSDEWLFKSKKPTVSFTPHGKQDVLVRVRNEVKDTWVSKDCLTVTATRDATEVPVGVSPVDDGFMLRFSPKEAHGVINVVLKATCRPRVQKEVDVHFGKGILVEVMEMTRHFAHDLSEMAPVAALEVERRLAMLKQFACSASWALCQHFTSTSHALYGKADHVIAEYSRRLVKFGVHFNAKRQFHEAVEKTRSAAKQTLTRLHASRDNARLQLFRTQIQAKLWWLKSTGQTEEYNRYREKAQSFVQEKEAITQVQDQSSRGKSPLWPRVVPTNLCQHRDADRGYGRTQECNLVA